ncbi:hypothetical protein CAAN1_11S03004 [[Candida] anglica]|uniref:Uncharacterized protein n=1 Tax=[Candida] anglica TaxID=148631 RepID=A0ABP0EI06_9ASCO
MIRQVSIVPGEGIGNSIQLGDTLYSIINKFQQKDHKMKIIYSDKEYLETPLVVILPSLGVRLTFENCNQQELLVIEIISFEFIKIVYNNFHLNEIRHSADDGFLTIEANGDEGGSEEEVENFQKTSSQEVLVKPPTLHQIYNKIFGPTYPGKLVDDCYILSYPGISFRFKILSQDLQDEVSKVSLNENSLLSQLLNWDKVDDIVCESLAIFNGDSWDEFFKSFKQYLLTKKKTKVSERFNGSKLIPKISKLIVNLSERDIKIILNSNKDMTKTSEFTIKIGETTQQEILNILGPPDDYFNKFDCRLLIHKHLKQSLSISNGGSSDTISGNSIDKFHNYFSLGLDFLYDLNPESKKSHNSTGILKKVVIHNGGVTKSLDFMRWNKCNWEIHTGKDGVGSDICVNSSMYFKDIPSAFFSTLNSQVIRPVLLNRNEAEFIDNDLDIINVNEVPAHHSKPGRNSNEKRTNQVKTWGQSKLYGGKYCIWEVVDSIGCITCVTIY